MIGMDGRAARKRRIGTVVKVLLGCLIGLAAAEGGLRLYFFEREADRTYWGRGDLILDSEIGRKYAPSRTMTVSREGSWGPAEIRSNPRGYRDPRWQVDRTSPATRILVSGGSFMLGLGIDEKDRESIFYAHLEKLMKAEREWPDGLEVYNCSQSALLLNEKCYLAEKEAELLAPKVVLLSVSAGQLHIGGMGRRPPYKLDCEEVDGYLLPIGRILRNTWLDTLRTRSFVVMRCSGGPLIKERPALRGMGLLERAFGPEKRHGEAELFQRVVGRLKELKQNLDKDTLLVCMVIYGRKRKELLVNTLRQTGFEAVEIFIGREHTFENDDHWTVEGHKKAAAIVAKRLGEILASRDETKART